MITQNSTLKTYQNLNQDSTHLSEITILPKKPSLDAALCQLEIKDHIIINIRYSPADHEFEDDL